MLRNIARIIAGFLLLIPAGAMHDTAKEYAAEPASLARLTTAKSVNFVANLMDMGATAMILIGAIPMFVSHFNCKPKEIPNATPHRAALPPPAAATFDRPA